MWEGAVEWERAHELHLLALVEDMQRTQPDGATPEQLKSDIALARSKAERAARRAKRIEVMLSELARALVVKPEIMLFDEPLSNLDAKLREEMRTELLEIQDKVKITSIYVTHDQEEALALADRVAVMTDGHIEQIGTPDEVYESPATAFVAKFLGESNVLPAKVAEVRGPSTICDAGDYRIRSEGNSRFAVGDRVEVVVRTERISLGSEPMTLDNCFRARLAHVIYLGGDIRYLLQLGEHRIVSVEKNRGDHISFQEGTDIFVGWSARDSLLVKLP